jgi:hypothetical protein
MTLMMCFWGAAVADTRTPLRDGAAVWRAARLLLLLLIEALIPPATIQWAEKGERGRRAGCNMCSQRWFQGLFPACTSAVVSCLLPVAQ